MLLEFQGDKASSFQIQLFGTDVNEHGIERVRAGMYQERISEEISPDRLRRFFTKVDEGYRVSKSVRDLCVFAKQNLAEDPPFSQMNLVACRNLLIYLGPALQSKIMPILHYESTSGGVQYRRRRQASSTYVSYRHLVDRHSNRDLDYLPPKGPSSTLDRKSP